MRGRVMCSEGQCLRARPWQGDRSVAYLAPTPGAPVPSGAFVADCVQRLAADGYRHAVTSALGPDEQRPFVDAGFTESERLHLLAHDLDELSRPHRRIRLRKWWRAARRELLAVDGAAFTGFWRLDGDGLDEAVHATPSTRVRIAGRPAIAYAISGRGGHQGYLQRLAVHPDHQRSGLGRSLTIDALRWMRRRGARRALVNTQLGNEPALTLYLRLGFRIQPAGLAVLRRDLV